MTRLRSVLVELAVGMAVAGAICTLAFQHEFRWVAAGLRTARPEVREPEYLITALGWGHLGEVRDLRDAGHFAGMAPDTNGRMRAAVWREGRTTLIDLPDCAYSRATALAADGSVLCNALTPRVAVSCRSYIWREEDEALLPVPSDEEGQICRATAINGYGQVVGVIGRRPPSCHGFVWRPDSGVAALDQAPSAANDINDRGQVVGWRGDDLGQKRACVWLPEPDGSYRRMDLAPDCQGWTEACALNDDGLVVGQGSQVGAFAWSEEDGLQVLPSPPQGLARADDVNAHGHIVGVARGSGARGAALWREGQAVDLNSVAAPAGVWELTRALAIGDDGLIACQGVSSEGTETVLLTPVALAGDEERRAR